jgi:deazaflavin-dependent oxidoreductase (nitroreductase family)
MYQRPPFIARNVANPALAFVIRYAGVTPKGVNLLSVRKRRSGGEQTVPITPIAVDDQRYLVSPRGNTDWAQNLRAAGEGKLVAGRRTEAFTFTEVPDAEKPRILRAYLKMYGVMTKSQFGVDANASEADLARIAPNHPVFRLTPS